MSARLPLQSKALRPKFENKRAVFGDDDDEEDKVIDERVIGIEDNKVKEAEPKKEKKPLVISPLPNVDFRATAKHKKELYIPAGAQQQQQQVGETKPELLEQSAGYGLQIQKKKVESTTENTVTVEETTTTTTVTIPTVDDAPKSLEERAIEAIIKESKGEVDEEEQGPKKVIPAAETVAFRDDYEKRPDETTMDDYERVPVDEFGAALLRGLGWNEGEGIGRNRKNAPAPPPTEVKQRDALLGLGAKPHQLEFKNDKEKSQHRREAYVYKDTSLFKKLSKRKVEEDRSSSSSRRSRDGDDRRGRDDDRKRRRRSRSRSSDRHRSGSRRRSRSRSPVSRSSSRRSSRSRSPASRSSSRRSSRSRSPASRSSSNRSSRRR